MTGLISRLRIRLLIAAAALALHTAQGQTVSGTVVDRLTREPIVGATVIDAATRKGTVSDIDGRFAISTAALPATLRISFIGYKPQEAVVTDAGRELAVSLEEEVNDLAEMVAVGYGTQRRTQLTGSVTKIKADVFASSPAPTLDGALGGAVAGLNVTAASGQPGAASSIRIRGGNSVNASNEPLYVIDGFIYYKDAGAVKTGLGAIESSLNPLSTVNPMDIESVEVLKDISATAIYGSRGANGVILVPTRRGSRDRTVVSYRYTVGLDAAAPAPRPDERARMGRLSEDLFLQQGRIHRRADCRPRRRHRLAGRHAADGSEAEPRAVGDGRLGQGALRLLGQQRAAGRRHHQFGIRPLQRHGHRQSRQVVALCGQPPLGMLPVAGPVVERRPRRLPGRQPDGVAAQGARVVRRGGQSGDRRLRIFAQLHRRTPSTACASRE